MIPGQQIVQRILRGDPGIKPATLLSKSIVNGQDTFTSYGWSVKNAPVSQQPTMGQNIETSKKTTTWTFLRENQTVLPKIRDRVNVIGANWTITDIVNERWDGYARDAVCVKDPS